MAPKKQKVSIAPINSSLMLKNYLEQYHHCQTQVNDVLAYIKREKEKIWSPVCNLKDEADALKQEILTYMRDKDLSSVKSNGKIFTFEDKVIESKASLSHIAELLTGQKLIDNPGVITDVRVQKIKPKLEVLMNALDLDSGDEDN